MWCAMSESKADRKGKRTRAISIHIQTHCDALQILTTAAADIQRLEMELFMVCKAIEDIFNQQYDIISKKSGEVGGWVFMINENAGKKKHKKRSSRYTGN